MIRLRTMYMCEVLAEKIPGAWLMQIEGGGHGLMFQYPEKFAKVLEAFLPVTT